MYKDAKEDRNKGNLGEKVQGQLSPDWVEWLMGWPIFWSSLEPITELLWLDWSVDPADVESNEMWLTPDAQMARHKTATDWEIKNRGPEYKLHCQVATRESKPLNSYIPRVATGIKDRVNRLKAIGNGQVSQCAATAWEILKP